MIRHTIRPVLVPVSSEISDFTPCAHAQNDILHIIYPEKTYDQVGIPYFCDWKPGRFRRTSLIR